jgi:hypothetical protein
MNIENKISLKNKIFLNLFYDTFKYLYYTNKRIINLFLKNIIFYFEYLFFSI